LVQTDPREFKDLALEFSDLLRTLPFQLPEDFLLLLRSISLISGVTSALNREFNMWDAVEPFSRTLLNGGGSSTLGALQREALSFASTALALPAKLDAVLSRADQGLLSIRIPEVEKSLRRIDSSARRIASALIFATLFGSGIALRMTGDELGGSEYLALSGVVGNKVPKVDAAKAYKRYQAYGNALSAGAVASCHDLSDGGLAVAAAESAFAGGFGMSIDLSCVLWKGDVAGKSDCTLLFSESASRHLVTVHPEKRDKFELIMSGNCFASIGFVTDEPTLTVTGLSGTPVIKGDLAGLKEAWQSTLREL
jgi:hypothetical protein